MSGANSLPADRRLTGEQVPIGPSLRKEGRRKAVEVRHWKGEHSSPDSSAVSVDSF